MATVTGDISIDFSGLGNANPYTDAAITPLGSGVQVASGAAKTTTTTGGFVTSTDPVTGVITAKIEVNSAHPSGDPIGPAILDTSGNGYWLRCHYSETRIYLVNAMVLGARVGAATNGGSTALDELELSLDPSTGGLISYLNGAQVESVTDATYSSGMRAGFISNFANNNNAGALSFAADGYSAPGPSISSTTDPTVDGVQSSITTSGLTGTPTTTLGGYSVTTAGTLPNLTYTLAISAITDNGPVSVPRIGDSLTLSVTGTEGTATSTVATSPAAGYATVTLAGTLAAETDGLIDKIQTQTGLTVAVGDILYYPTTDSTSISTTGVLTTDSTSFDMLLIQGGNATTAGNGYGLTIVPATGEVVTSILKQGKMGLSNIRIGL